MTRTSNSVPLTGISRRTFCKGAAVLGVWGGLASFGLAGCAPHSRAEELADSAPWKAGTYTTEVTGHNAPYTMTVTFSDDAITAIDTSANQESLGVGADALKALQQQAIDNQTINIDAVTGATLSSLSLQTGLEDCAKQAQAFRCSQAVPETGGGRGLRAPTCASWAAAARAWRRPSRPCRPARASSCLRSVALPAVPPTSPRAR
ncbi:MAG: FMN-binding protein [Adlercreutzia equolifaciens]